MCCLGHQHRQARQELIPRSRKRACSCSDPSVPPHTWQKPPMSITHNYICSRLALPQMEDEQHLPVIITQLKRTEASLAEVRILNQQTQVILKVLFRIHQIFQLNFILVSQRGTENVHRRAALFYTRIKWFILTTEKKLLLTHLIFSSQDIREAWNRTQFSSRFCVYILKDLPRISVNVDNYVFPNF